MVRYPVDIRASINTDTLAQDVKAIGAGPCQVNTGIERDGGVTNLYLYSAALVYAGVNVFISDSGAVVSIYPLVP